MKKKEMTNEATKPSKPVEKRSFHKTIFNKQRERYLALKRQNNEANERITTYEKEKFVSKGGKEDLFNDYIEKRNAFAKSGMDSKYFKDEEFFDKPSKKTPSIFQVQKQEFKKEPVKKDGIEFEKATLEKISKNE